MADAPVLTSATFAAGCIAGAAGQLVGHPLDTIKVWAQTGSRDAVRLPFRALFRGIAGPIVSAGGVQSVRLGMYETFRRCWGPSEASTPLPVVGLSSASAGLVVSFILCPLHRVKVAQQLYGGGLYATARQLRREGSLYRGPPATANAPYVSLWTALDPTTRENGTLVVLPARTPGHRDAGRPAARPCDLERCEARHGAPARLEPRPTCCRLRSHLWSATLHLGTATLCHVVMDA